MSISDDITAADPSLDQALISEFLDRTDDEYLKNTEITDIPGHIRAVNELSAEKPFRLLYSNHDGTSELTIISYNLDAVFSLICGILSSCSLPILSGICSTLKRKSRPGGRPAGNTGKTPILPERMIIDTFRLSGTIDSNQYAKILGLLGQVVSVLLSDYREGPGKAAAMVRELVARSMQKSSLPHQKFLLPVDIDVEEIDTHLLRFVVRSEDTPYFLYSLSSAMASTGISIEEVSIKTEDNTITDTFLFSLPVNRNISIDDIRLYILLAKQFTCFLGNAPDPGAAFERFEKLLRDMLEQADSRRIAEYIAKPFVLKDLAVLLGMSEYLWEDFIRGQYEQLVPLLGNSGFSYRDDPPVLVRLRQALEGTGTEEAFTNALNRFKDEQIFLTDLDHILNPDSDFRLLSKRLTRLAEAVCAEALDFCWNELVNKYGTPCTITGETCPYGLFGLGKMGGEALGYASDIELLLVYSDNGKTDGQNSIANSAFFEELVKNMIRIIKAKREGIFSIDLRLRPWGKSAPLACSLEHFCSYYGPGGDAHSLEMLALVRLRAIHGEAGFLRHIEQLRDDYLYCEGSIDLAELRKARTIQFEQKRRGDLVNVKFSVGGLVDLEYAVQILQIEHGKQVRELRTPSIHKALDSLVLYKLIEPDEADSLVSAYHFLRKLINALRMLRGSALDLYLPVPGSSEFFHLARRMGYLPKDELTAETQLLIDYQTITAGVRHFVEKRLGRDSLPASGKRNIADLVLSEQISEERISGILGESGIANSARAYINIREMASGGDQARAFARIAVPAFRLLKNTSDPDMSLNNWERLVSNIENPAEHYRKLLHKPVSLEIMLNIFAYSQYLSDIIIKRPNYLDWLMNSEILMSERSADRMAEDLGYIEQSCRSESEWIDSIRKFKKTELLRISARDICSIASFENITAEISNLADSIITMALQRIWREAAGENACPLVIIAFGKLGGRELNYSSDIDLLAVHFTDKPGENEEILYRRTIEKLRSDLSVHTAEGFAYRVDFRLRPFGSSGTLVPSLHQLEEYYSNQASMWEIQAAIKARPLAGPQNSRQQIRMLLDRILRIPHGFAEITGCSNSNLTEAVKKADSERLGGKNIKTGSGGIRFIEFLVQPLQLSLASKHPSVLSSNTLEAIALLEKEGCLKKTDAAALSSNYLWLRRLEHGLQLYEDRQTHSLPADAARMTAVARRMGEQGLDDFYGKLEAILEENSRLYASYILQNDK
ncbi:MAG: glutamate-ammonia-ligase adenylyltransferase [Spirochaetales bacterium]|nr:glutamate-ammonia-ligase adenylyltransferase [Spirochaetales bacterium]